MESIEIVAASAGGIVLQMIQEKMQGFFNRLSTSEKVILSVSLNFTFAAILFVATQIQNGISWNETWKLLFNFGISYISNQAKHRIAK